MEQLDRSATAVRAKESPGCSNFAASTSCAVNSGAFFFAEMTKEAAVWEASEEPRQASTQYSITFFAIAIGEWAPDQQVTLLTNLRQLAKKILGNPRKS